MICLLYKTILYIELKTNNTNIHKPMYSYKTIFSEIYIPESSDMIFLLLKYNQLKMNNS